MLRVVIIMAVLGLPATAFGGALHHAGNGVYRVDCPRGRPRPVGRLPLPCAREPERSHQAGAHHRARLGSGRRRVFPDRTGRRPPGRRARRHPRHLAAFCLPRRSDLPRHACRGGGQLAVRGQQLAVGRPRGGRHAVVVRSGRRDSAESRHENRLSESHARHRRRPFRGRAVREPLRDGESRFTRRSASS